MEWYIAVLQKYLVFEGRARRKEYWMFSLFSFLVALVLGIVDTVVLGTGGMIGGLYALAVLLPGLGVTVRRLHDIGKSGWWIFISLVPFIGILILIYFTIKDSEGDNHYGPRPK